MKHVNGLFCAVCVYLFRHVHLHVLLLWLGSGQRNTHAHTSRCYVYTGNFNETTTAGTFNVHGREMFAIPTIVNLLLETLG